MRTAPFPPGRPTPPLFFFLPPLFRLYMEGGRLNEKGTNRLFFFLP